MARSIFLSNGSLMVGYDQFGQVHDLYYPYVGQQAHTSERTSAHKIGVWVDGQMSWFDNGDWQVHIDYDGHTMGAKVVAQNEKIKIRVVLHDFVDFQDDVFIRSATIHNNSGENRDIRLFFHQRFEIDEQSRGDTATFVPRGHYILDFRGRICFAIGAASSGQSFDQYSIGSHGIEGKEGTYRDADDGELSGNPIEHGSVDSCLRLRMEVPGKGSCQAQYWIAAAQSHHRADILNEDVSIAGIARYEDRTRRYWQSWLKPAEKKLSKLRPLTYESAIKSLLIVKSHIDKHGSILASGDSEMLNYSRDNYSYCWPRDGAYILRPLIELGLYDDARRFFEFMADTIAENGSIMHKHQPDRSVGSTWHPLIQNGRPELAIQEDETAIVIVTLEQYLGKVDDLDYKREMFNRLVRPAADFMANYVDEQTGLPHPSYGLWEQIFATFTYTTASVYAGLRSASRIAKSLGQENLAIKWDVAADDISVSAEKRIFNSDRNYFYKSLTWNPAEGKVDYDPTIDSSALYGVVNFGLFDAQSDECLKSIESIERALLNNDDGFHGLPRYEEDMYVRRAGKKPNPWFVCTLWLAQIYHRVGRQKEAIEIVEWTRMHMSPSGVLPEQIDPETDEPLSVAPLIWSQAEYLHTIAGLIDSKASF